VTPEGWDATFALLVRGPAVGMTNAAPLMRERGGGSIINTASIAGLEAGWGPLAYSTAKGAVIHMTRCAAADLSPQKIRVNAICPGVIATSIFGTALGMPRDAADQMAARVAENATKVQPIPKADKRTLLRRVTFDLTGLPPTPDELREFLADSTPSAFSTVVDRLLASPRYGERWGRFWLDVARYADSKGYVFEQERRFSHSYTYRDWVVNALNHDLPYDQFLIQQRQM
jgi:NAD(P)-dependent dehydrogenase (short-subunit alcohol dehydrogenase family)